jgi:hypothetical protein
MKVITMEEMTKRVNNTRSRSKAVFQNYNSNMAANPLTNLKRQERNPDEQRVLDRFKLR